MTKNYRITTLGFISMSLIVLVMTFLLAVVVRESQNSNKVIYGINKTRHQEVRSFDSTFSFKTIGDAVIYDSIDISSHNYINYSGDSLYIEGTFDSNLTQLPHYQILLEDAQLTLKTNDSISHLGIPLDQVATHVASDDVVSLTELWSILRLTEEEVYQFNNRGLPLIISDLPLVSTEANSYTLKMTIREWFDTTDELIGKVSRYPDFTQRFQQSFSAFYDFFAYYTLSKDNQLKARPLSPQQVDIKGDFYNTYNQYLQSIEDKFESLFTDESYLAIKLYLVDNQIASIHLQSDLYYKSCDAYESIEFSVLTTDIKEPGLVGN